MGAQEFTLKTELWLPRPRSEVFPFFAEARNLEELTPPFLNFTVLTPPPIEMRAGLLIDYRLKVHGLPVYWRTEILDWEPPHRFVDTQLRGPYWLWHHTHTFEEKDGGTLCGDLVRYRPIGGALMNWLFVRRDVENIFAYRTKVLLAKFGSKVD
jgi:ligand-binding SRPBCC domain-containing protein